MFAALKATLKTSCVAGALMLASSQGQAFDSLRASFDLMLDHEPAAMPAAATHGGSADPLLAAMVLPLRDGLPPTRALASDPVAESFARMMQHEPNRHVPPLPRGEGADPLIAAIVLPLVRSNYYAVAGVTAPRFH
jgi:hypothetical protein